jgi:hypothetical protein
MLLCNIYTQNILYVYLETLGDTLFPCIFFLCVCVCVYARDIFFPYIYIYIYCVRACMYVCENIYILGTLCSHQHRARIHSLTHKSLSLTHTDTSSIPIEKKNLLPHLDWQREHILTPIKKNQSATICSE